MRDGSEGLGKDGSRWVTDYSRDRKVIESCDSKITSVVEEGEIDFNGGGLASAQGQVPRPTTCSANVLVPESIAAAFTCFVTMRQPMLSQCSLRTNRRLAID